jgi:hypothetical protein
MRLMRVNQQTNWVSDIANSASLFVLVLCLLLSQTLGFMHGIEHAPHSGHHSHQNYNHPVVAASEPIASEPSALEQHSHWIADLFTGHGEESTCQVFEQLSYGGALIGSAVEIPLFALSSFFLDTYQGATPYCHRSLIQARGPPAVTALV